MDEILRILITTFLGIIGLAALMTAAAALFTRSVSDTQEMAQESPGRSFWVGLVNLMFFAAIAMGFFAFSEWTGLNFLVFPALLALAILISGSSLGLAGVAGLTGHRVVPDRTKPARTIWGTVLLTVACLFPFAGWFLLFPYIVCLGLGAFILSLFRRARPQSPVEPPVLEE